MKLSIIIPVYNTAKYLRKCIDSCLQQNVPHSEYEIILINDGSTDESQTICDEYKNNYKNIIFKQQINAGQSVARNNALQIAKGDYIWFIDSDDYIRKNSLSAIINLCFENNLDMLRIGYQIIQHDSTIDLDSMVSDLAISISDGKKYLKSVFVFGPPLYIFRKEYLFRNKLLFYPNIYHEDNEFTPRAIYFAGRVGEIKQTIYYVYLRPESTTRTSNSTKNCRDLLIVCQNLIVFSENIDKDCKLRFNDIVSTSYNSALNYASKLSRSELKIFQTKTVYHKNIFRRMIRSNKLIYKIEGLIFLVFPSKAVTVYRNVKKILG